MAKKHDQTQLKIIKNRYTVICDYFLTSEYFRHCNQLTMSGSSGCNFKGNDDEEML